MPGTSGGWSNRPSGDQWDNEMDDDELSLAGRTDEYNYGLPFASKIDKRVSINPHDSEEDNLVPVTFHIPDDKDTETEDDPIRDFIKMTAPSKFVMSPGHARKYSRHQPGMTWKESVREKMIEAFISLKDTPYGKKEKSHSMHDVDLDFIRDRFNKASVHGMKHIQSCDEPDLVRFLIQIEPDHFMKSLGSVGKDKLMNIYDEWISEVLDSDSGRIDKMAERITKAIGKAGK
jgi:hypothetical protein